MKGKKIKHGFDCNYVIVDGDGMPTTAADKAHDLFVVEKFSNVLPSYLIFLDEQAKDEEEEPVEGKF